MSDNGRRGDMAPSGNPSRTAGIAPRFSTLYGHLARMLANRDPEILPRSVSVYYRAGENVLAVARGDAAMLGSPVVAFGAGQDVDAALKALDKAVQGKKWNRDTFRAPK